jgi:radical SAM protein with 4Fe4S-binding SPASM domain
MKGIVRDIKKYFGTKKADKFPADIKIEFSSVCNFVCPMCPMAAGKLNRTSFLTEETIRKIVDEIAEKKLGVKTIALSLFGESFINKKFFDHLKIIHEVLPHVKTRISTNFGVIDEAMALKLAKSSISEISISIDSLDKEIYAKQRHGGNIEKTLKNVNCFLALRNKHNPKIKVQINFVRTKLNKEGIKEFISYWESKLSKGDSVKLIPGHSWAGQADDDDLIESYKFGFKKVCSAPFDNLCIFTNGDCTVCCMDSFNKLNVGNVVETSLEEVWNSSKMKRMRSRFLKKDYRGLICANCEVSKFYPVKYVKNRLYLVKEIKIK